MYFGANTVMELQLSYWLVVSGLQLPRAQFCWIYSRIYHSLEDFSWTFSWLYAMCCLYAVCFSALSVLFHVLAQNRFNLCKLWPYFQGRKLLKSVKFCVMCIFFLQMWFACVMKTLWKSSWISFAPVYYYVSLYFLLIPNDIFLSSHPDL